MISHTTDDSLDMVNHLNWNFLITNIPLCRDHKAIANTEIKEVKRVGGDKVHNNKTEQIDCRSLKRKIDQLAQLYLKKPPEVHYWLIHAQTIIKTRNPHENSEYQYSQLSEMNTKRWMDNDRSNLYWRQRTTNSRGWPTRWATAASRPSAGRRSYRSAAGASPSPSIPRAASSRACARRGAATGRTIWLHYGAGAAAAAAAIHSSPIGAPMTPLSLSLPRLNPPFHLPSPPQNTLIQLAMHPKIKKERIQTIQILYFPLQYRKSKSTKQIWRRSTRFSIQQPDATYNTSNPSKKRRSTIDLPLVTTCRRKKMTQQAKITGKISKNWEERLRDWWGRKRPFWGFFNSNWSTILFRIATGIAGLGFQREMDRENPLARSPRMRVGLAMNRGGWVHELFFSLSFFYIRGIKIERKRGREIN